MTFAHRASHQLVSADITDSRATFNFRNEAGYDEWLKDNFIAVADEGYQTTERWGVDFQPQLTLTRKHT